MARANGNTGVETRVGRAVQQATRNVNIGFVERRNSRKSGGYVDGYSHQPNLAFLINYNSPGTVNMHVLKLDLAAALSNANT